MGKRINQLGKGTCYHGNAGLASAFAALAHRKLKPGGVLALVLPLAVTAGLSWRSFRQMLNKGYTDLDILSIVANNTDDMSFSADTGLGECLIIARKLTQLENPNKRGGFVSLKSRPQEFAQASSIAKSIIETDHVRKIEDGPHGGTLLLIGDQQAGEMITAPTNASGAVWGAVRLADYSVAQSAYALSHSTLWLPGIHTDFELNMAPLSVIGRLGLVHRDITPPPRGPFIKTSYSPTATYPALWNHNAKKETRIVCIPDSELRVYQGLETKAAEVWNTASRAHLSLGFRFNSQPLSATITEQRTMGGTVWPNVSFCDARFDYAFAVWGNSTLGLLSYWWHSNRQQGGRGWITIRSAETLPILDLRALTHAQLATAKHIFDDFRDRDLMPAYLADADSNRARLDKRVICDLLGFDLNIYQAVRLLAAKWCAEPSVHGGKKRPRSATLII